MALFIDPPRWPAHGTVFSHLISDTSLGELHDFAQGIGLDSRAFDEDHYDVPERRYDAAVAAGALPVMGSELIRLLRASGLRVPAKERVAGTIQPLRHRWRELGIGRDDLGEELLQRWSEPHRSYHTPVHLLHCLEMIDKLAAHAGQSPSLEVRLAAWFHDAVYDGVPGRDEEASANLAISAIGGKLGAEVARLVLLTRDHQVEETDRDGGILVDADLSILGESAERYARYRKAVRSEYRSITDVQWNEGRRQVLRRLLGQKWLFNNDWTRRMVEAAARTNLQKELADLLPRRPHR